MWNTDTSYDEGTDPIYQSIPFYLGWEMGQVYGIFFDTSYRAEFDMGKTQQEYVSFSAETSPDDAQLDYYFFWGPSMKKVVSRYADLTGHMPLPPRWALGHQQSRWSYYPDKTVEELVDRYRADDLPLDVVYLDIDYMDDYRVFTWSPRNFPDPRGLIARLGRQGVKVVTIVDPGVKYQPRQPGYRVFDEGTAHDFFLRRRGGAVYVGAVWPGRGGVHRLHEGGGPPLVGRPAPRLHRRRRRRDLERHERAERLRRQEREVAGRRGQRRRRRRAPPTRRTGTSSARSCRARPTRGSRGWRPTSDRSSSRAPARPACSGTR